MFYQSRTKEKQYQNSLFFPKGSQSGYASGTTCSRLSTRLRVHRQVLLASKERILILFFFRSTLVEHLTS
jgi:hypothetical protein